MKLDGIYQGQVQLNIRLYCGTSIKGALETIIKYKKPSGKTGSWPAVIDDENKGIISYKINHKSTLDEIGSWTIWSYITFADGRPAPGSAVSMLIKEEGS